LFLLSSLSSDFSFLISFSSFYLSRPLYIPFFLSFFLAFSLLLVYFSVPFHVCFSFFQSGHLTFAVELFTSSSNQEFELSERLHTLLFRTPLPSETRFNCSDSPPTPPLNPSCLCLPLLQLAAAVGLRI
jgi:hypothetical protein